MKYRKFYLRTAELNISTETTNEVAQFFQEIKKFGKLSCGKV